MRDARDNMDHDDDVMMQFCDDMVIWWYSYVMIQTMTMRSYDDVCTLEMQGDLLWGNEENKAEENYEGGDNRDLCCCKFLWTKWMTMFDQQIVKHSIIQMHFSSTRYSCKLISIFNHIQTFFEFITSMMNDECLICPASDICAQHTCLHMKRMLMRG